ncbi:MAG: LysR family transcriptional regulator [Sphingobium sp.]|nr:LysR family transcriptional regulator [Sphingobium sp.]
MDIRQLRHFIAVAETLHFGKAAEKLGMTQPPLSQSILALEREIGAPLFSRTKRSVALTPLGEQWRPHVVATLSAMAALPDLARRIRDGETGRLDLSFVSTADYSILPLLVQLYAAQYPDVAIHLTEATSDVQIEHLLEGRVQAGLIIPPPGALLPSALIYRPLVREPLVAAIPESWIASGRLPITHGTITAEAVTGAPLIIFPRRSAPAFHDLVTGYYAAHGQQAQIVQEAIQMQTIISLVSAGMGLTLVPASLCNLARTGVRYVPLAQDKAQPETAPCLETGIIWRRDDHSPIVRQLVDLTRNLPNRP